MGLRVQDLEFRVTLYGSRLRVEGVGFRFYVGCRVQALWREGGLLRYRVEDFGVNRCLLFRLTCRV